MTKTVSFPTDEKITEWLEENGYDGFYNETGECGCSIGDLFPCGCSSAITDGECKAATRFKATHNSDGEPCEYLMFPIYTDEE